MPENRSPATSPGAAGRACSIKPGVVETSYRVKGDTTTTRRALARIFALPGGFRLMVGHDLAEGESLMPILCPRPFEFAGLSFTVIGTLGGLFLARRVLRRDRWRSTPMRGPSPSRRSLRPPAACRNRRRTRPSRREPQCDARARISELMAGLKEVSDNVAHDLKTPLDAPAQPAPNRRCSLAPDTGDDYREALEKVIEESPMGIIKHLRRAPDDRAGRSRRRPRRHARFRCRARRKRCRRAVRAGRRKRAASSFEGAIESVNLIVHGSRELIGQALANLRRQCPQVRCRRRCARIKLGDQGPSP